MTRPNPFERMKLDLVRKDLNDPLYGMCQFHSHSISFELDQRSTVEVEYSYGYSVWIRDYDEHRNLRRETKAGESEFSGFTAALVKAVFEEHRKFGQDASEPQQPEYVVTFEQADGSKYTFNVPQPPEEAGADLPWIIVEGAHRTGDLLVGMQFTPEGVDLGYWHGEIGMREWTQFVTAQPMKP